MNKLKTFHLSYFTGKDHLEEDGAQKYLVFQSIVRYFEVITTAVDYIASGQSTRLYAETIKPPTASNNSLTPTLL